PVAVLRCYISCWPDLLEGDHGCCYRRDDGRQAGQRGDDFAWRYPKATIDHLPFVRDERHLSFCHLCWRKWQPSKTPDELLRHILPSRMIAPHQTGACTRT